MSGEILQHYLNEFRAGGELSTNDAAPLLDALIESADETLLADVLTAWEEKGVAEDELFCLASVMRSRMRRISHSYADLVDIVGTGGSRAKTFNVSTAAAFVVAGAGVPVAKHGNRAATSSSGSADVLDFLGVRADVEPELAERCLADHGICFMFAPKYHRLSPTLGLVRRKLKRPTLFNCLGPLCNPAGAEHQLIGVWHEGLVNKVANVLRRLGTRRSWVVNAQTGLDEIACHGETSVAEVDENRALTFYVSDADFRSPNGHGPVPDSIGPEQSANLIRQILENKQRGSNSEKLVLMNAAAAIYISGNARNLPDAFAIAAESVVSGKALGKLNSLIETTNR